jgi:aubergine-like protein
VKVYDLSKSSNLLLTFLNNSLRNIMRKLNYVEIGKSGKYFNAKDKSSIDNLTMYNGFKSNFVSLEKGYFLRVDAAKKIVRNETALEFIDSVYKQYRDLSKEEKRMHVKNGLVGMTVMSNYGKTNYYRVSDVQFNELETVIFDSSETKLLDYYKDKYKIIINNMKQPLLVAEGKDKTKPLLLVPELMLMTGIPENFDEQRRKKISEQTIKMPGEKYKEIGGLMEKLKNLEELEALNEMGIKVSRKMEELKAKLIPSPILELGSKNTI